MNINECLDRYIQRLNESTEKGGYGVTRKDGEYTVEWYTQSGNHTESFDTREEAMRMYEKLYDKVDNTDKGRSDFNGLYTYTVAMGKTEATEWERYKESAIWQYLRAQTGETNKIDISGWGTLAYDPLVKLIKVKPEFSVDRWKYKDGNHRANVAAATRANEL